MSPRSASELVLERPPLLSVEDTVREAVRVLVDSDLPGLPVVDAAGRLVGIFGEREFIGAVFPGYVTELGYAGFVPRSVEEVLQKRATCATEPVGKYMNTEHIEVTEDFADVQLAEIFLHHRVLIVPVTRERRVVGVVTRSAFFATLGERFLRSPDDDGAGAGTT